MGASCASELKLSCTLGNYYECISMTYYSQVGSEAANTLPFLQLGTRLFTPSRTNKDYNKEPHVKSKLSVITAYWILALQIRDCQPVPMNGQITQANCNSHKTFPLKADIKRHTLYCKNSTAMGKYNNPSPLQNLAANNIYS